MSGFSNNAEPPPETRKDTVITSTETSHNPFSKPVKLLMYSEIFIYPPRKIGIIEKLTSKNDGKIGNGNFIKKYKILDIAANIAVSVIL